LSKCINLVLSNSKQWDGVKIIAFDAPLAVDKTYEERLQILRQSIPIQHPVLAVVEPVVCKDKNHFQNFYNEMCTASTEGVVLRDPKAWYFKQDSFFKKDVGRNCDESYILSATRMI
jgi:ATP-dependent DNA ligase